MQRAALHAAAVAVSIENITVKSTPKKTAFVTAEAVTFVVFKNYDYSNPIAVSSLRNQFSTQLFPHDEPLTAALRVQKVVYRSGFSASLNFNYYMEGHIYSEVSVPLE